MLENNVAAPKVATGDGTPVKVVVEKSAPERPAWASNACDSETVVADSENEAVRDANLWGLRQLFAGQDVNELCAGLARELAKDSFWEKVKRKFSTKVAAVRVTEDIALYPPDRRYAGFEGYDGFAYIREATSYSTLVRIPDEMLEDPGLLVRVKAGVAKTADELRRTGKIDVVRDFKSAVAV